MLRSDLQCSAHLCLCGFFFMQVMDDVGNQTSCRLAGLRPGTVYFVQVCPGVVVSGNVLERVRFFLCVHDVIVFCRFAVTLWVSTALGKLGSGASGAILPLHPHPTVVSKHSYTTLM